MSIAKSHEEACLSREFEAENKQAEHEEFVHDNMVVCAEYGVLLAEIRKSVESGNIKAVIKSVKELEQLAYAHQEELAKLDWDECVERGE